MSWPVHRRGSNRRGSVLLTVLLVIVIASLIGAGSIYTARAEALSASVSLRRTQARALAWSGVQGVMAELADQREDILDGQEPRLSEEWELFEDAGVRAVVRLVPVDEAGGLVASESARLNINTASVEMLKAAGLEQAEAEAIITARGERPFASTQALLDVEGASAAKLRGVPGSEEAGAPLLERLTVFSFDPNIQTGLGNDASRHRGKLRVNLAAEWSDRLAAAIDDRFGDGASEAVKRVRERGMKLSSMTEIVGALNNLGIEHGEWPGILDAFTTTDDPYIPGRVDLLRAPVEVIACIPGLDRAAAEGIVEAREGLDAEARRSIAWPVVQEVITPAQMAQAADYLTTRSLQWRVRIEVGLTAPDRGDSSARDVELRDRLVWEVVVDIASERPRVAYLRDVTMEAAAGALYESLLDGGEEALGAEAPLESLLPEVRGAEGSLPATSPLSFYEAPAEVPGLNLPGIEPRAELNFGSGLRASNSRGRNRGESSSGRAQFGDLEWAGFGEEGGQRPGPWKLESDDEEGSAAPAGVDRRLGRWTAGKQGASR